MGLAYNLNQEGRPTIEKTWIKNVKYFRYTVIMSSTFFLRVEKYDFVSNFMVKRFIIINTTASFEFHKQNIAIIWFTTQKRICQFAPYLPSIKGVVCHLQKMTGICKLTPCLTSIIEVISHLYKKTKKLSSLLLTPR